MNARPHIRARGVKVSTIIDNYQTIARGDLSQQLSTIIKQLREDI